MSKATLVIMAAGIGSRFGGGIKQLEPVGLHGEIIMDYSIYDALKVGFDKIVFVIRKNLEEDFKKVIGNRIEKLVSVSYAFQEIEDVPKPYQGRFTKRKKPWGTGQAILCCKNLVKDPFLVINADDYYGKEAFEEAYTYLTTPVKQSEKLEISMVSFVLKNTLSEHGGVTRGVCSIDEHNMLSSIQETHGIEKQNNKAVVTGEGKEPFVIDIESPVSMNMWGLKPEIFSVLEQRFSEFLDRISGNEETAEYLLPTIVGELLIEGKLDVKVLKSRDKWFGVTYKEDKLAAAEAVKDLIEAKAYPERLFD